MVDSTSQSLLALTACWINRLPAFKYILNTT